MFKVGDSIRIIKNISSHRYELGKSYKIYSIQNNGVPHKNYILVDNNGNVGNTYCLETEFIISFKSKKDIEAEIENKTFEIFELEDKLKFIEEMNTEEFDENQFHIYRMIKLMNDSNLDSVGKQKQIRTIIEKIV